MRQTTKNLIRGVGIAAVMAFPVASLGIGTFKAFKPMVDHAFVSSSVETITKQKPEDSKIKSKSANVAQQLPSSTDDPLIIAAGGLVVATLSALAGYAKFRFDRRLNHPTYPPLGTESKTEQSKGDLL